MLQFTYTPTYPDELPRMEVESYENIDEEQADPLLQFMKEEVRNYFISEQN